MANFVDFLTILMMKNYPVIPIDHEPSLCGNYAPLPGTSFFSSTSIFTGATPRE